MKKTVKLLSVTLALIIVLTSFPLISFATDESNLSDYVTFETKVVKNRLFLTIGVTDKPMFGICLFIKYDDSSLLLVPYDEYSDGDTSCNTTKFVCLADESFSELNLALTSSDVNRQAGTVAEYEFKILEPENVTFSIDEDSSIWDENENTISVKASFDIDLTDVQLTEDDIDDDFDESLFSFSLNDNGES